MYELQYVPLALPFFLLFFGLFLFLAATAVVMVACYLLAQHASLTSIEGVLLPKMLPKAFTRSTIGHDSWTIKTLI